MHLIDLGVAKQIIVSLLKGKVVGFVGGKEAFGRLATTHSTYSVHSPSEFCRRPRTLNDVFPFKATEFRQFLLYTGMVVLKDHLTPNCLLHIVNQ